MKHIHIYNSSLELPVTIPSSKSISNRLLLLQKTTGIPIFITNLSTAEDTMLLFDLLNQIETSSSRPTYLYCDNCGTAYRFLSAYLACLPGVWVLDGNERMHQRPIKPLVNALVNAGADIAYLEESGFPPLQINGKKLIVDNWEIDSQQSSQYVSAIAMIVPLAYRNCEIVFSANSSSLQYIDMTLKLMQKLGFNIEQNSNTITYIEEERRNTPISLFVEYDWSSAAIWFALAALSSNANFLIHGLEKSELQADTIIAEWIKPFGVQTKYEEDGVRLMNTPHKLISDSIQLDCNNNLDLVPCMASLCVGSKKRARLENVQNLSIKESDRINALVLELGKISHIKYEANALIIEPHKEEFPNTICFSSHNDHRIAMALSILSFCIDDLYIDNPECVVKSYPDFWGNFDRITNKK